MSLSYSDERINPPFVGKAKAILARRASFCIKMHHFLQSSQLREPIETRRDRAQWRTTAHSQLTRRTAQSELNKQSQPARLYATPEFL